MGIFSSKKKTYVSSVTYNLGGDEEENHDVLKYAVLQSIMQKRQIVPSMTGALLEGQGIQLRRGFDFASKSYTSEMPYSATGFINAPDLSSLQIVLQEKHPGSTIELVTTFVGSADFTFWMEEWLANEFGYDRTTGRFTRAPKGVEDTALVSYDLSNGGIMSAILTNSDGTVHIYTQRLSGINFLATYIHCVYTTTQRFRNADGTTTVKVSSPIYFTYRVGLGTYPTLDTAYGAVSLGSPYFPSVPLRVNNVDYTSTSRRSTPLYKNSVKYLDKLGIDLEEIADQINENESIKDIDYAFLVLGVALNTKTKAGRMYLWKFIQHLQSISAYNRGDFESWESSPMTNRANPKTNTLKIYHPTAQKDRYNVQLQWQFIELSSASGRIQPDARIGDYDVFVGSERIHEFSDGVMRLDYSNFYIRQQVTENSYQQYVISGLTFENHIYNGHSVTITARDALTKADEEGFILPLHQPTLLSMPLRYSTQLGYECSHAVFNSYQVVKQKWYQRGWFKVLVVIVSIIIVVVTWGSGSGAAAGMVSATGAKGAAIAAAAALGATGVLLTYLAATIYVLGMMVLSTLFTKGATKLFGEEWGAVIAAIAMIVVGNVGNSATAAANGASRSMFSLSAAQIIQGTSAVLQGYGAHIQSKIQDVQLEGQQAQEDYLEEMKKIEDLMKDFNGFQMIDIEGYMDSTNRAVLESSDTFLARTLLTGSDIAQITQGLITNFSDMSLSTALPG